MKKHVLIDLFAWWNNLEIVYCRKCGHDFEVRNTHWVARLTEVAVGPAFKRCPHCGHLEAAHAPTWYHLSWVDKARWILGALIQGGSQWLALVTVCVGLSFYVGILVLLMQGQDPERLGPPWPGVILGTLWFAKFLVGDPRGDPDAAVWRRTLWWSGAVAEWAAMAMFSLLIWGMLTLVAAVPLVGLGELAWGLWPSLRHWIVEGCLLLLSLIAGGWLTWRWVLKNGQPSVTCD